jgi:L-2-hydroxycarboxylate dehydrogenase (NAD+)
VWKQASVVEHDPLVPSASSSIAPDQLSRQVGAVLVYHGVRRHDADAQVQSWVEADLSGRGSHGVQRLPTFLGRIRNRVINVAAEPAYRWLSEPVLEVDGDDGVGPAVAREAVAMIERRAASTGVAVALLRRTSHLGMLAPYVERLARSGLMALALTTSEPLVHPWGGALAMLGTNPIALGLPADPDPPLVLDMSTGATSAGTIRQHLRTQTPLESGWAVDAHGTSTLDAAAALHGAISPFGGAKGYGLGLALGVLVAGLTDTELGRRVTGTLDEDQPITKGDVLVCFDPKRLGTDPAARTAAYLRELRASPPANEGAPVRVPGDRARETRAQRLREGIPLDSELTKTIADLYQVATQGGS